MKVLYFLATLAAIALAGWIVSKITGSHAWFIEDWQFNPGETVLWRDDGSDTYLIGSYGQAQAMSFARLRRGFVVVTSERLIIGMRPLFGNKRMVQYVLYPSAPADGQSGHLDGGLLTKGYQTLVYQRGAAAVHPEAKKPYVDLTPASGEASSTNLRMIRIFTDLASTFRLP